RQQAESICCEGWGALLQHRSRTRPPLLPGSDSTAPRGDEGVCSAGPESRERCGSRYSYPFLVERVRIFCSEFVTAARNRLRLGEHWRVGAVDRSAGQKQVLPLRLRSGSG